MQLTDIYDYIISMFHHYYGDMIYLVLTVISAIFLYYTGKKQYRLIVRASVVLYLFIWNPLFYKFIFSRIVFWRLFWMIPTFLLITLAFAEGLSRLKGGLKRLILTIICILVIILFGNNIYKDLYHGEYTDPYRLPNNASLIASAMLEKDDHPRCILPHDLISWIRLYSGDIEPLYGRNAEGYINDTSADVDSIYASMNSDSPDYNYILYYARLNGYNFVINNDSKPININSTETFGYELMANMAGFNIYYNPNISDEMFSESDPSYGSELIHADTGWQLILPSGELATSTVVNIYGYNYYVNSFGFIIDDLSETDVESFSPDDVIITQYGRDNYGKPSMCYTIDDQHGTFIVIDGGNPEEAAIVMNTVRMYGNHIDAWILTHPHEDHIGAFNEIYRNCVLTGELSIDQIYAIDIDPEYYEQIAQPWDNIYIFHDFNSLTAQIDNLTYVQRGETYSIGNISFKVYNTFTDESYNISTGSLPNAATMVLEVFGPEGENGQSMLFLGDLEQGNADLIAGIFDDELHADYVQAAHHGQNIDYDFYELIGASTVAVDAPAWLRLENPDTHTAFEHLQWFNEEGLSVLTYDSTPNTIILHTGE